MSGSLGARTRSYTFDASGAGAEEWLTGGYPPAMRELAKMQLLGQGGDKEVPAALDWLARAKPKDKEAAILYDALKARGY
jgi:TPR repeat protein